MPIKDLLEEWHAQPRPLILIDEIRPDDRLQRGRQFYIYTAVLTDTRTACEIAWSAAGLREFHLKAEEHARALKGRVLFGAAPDARHEPFRNLFYSAMARCEGTATVVTSNEVIRRDRRIVRGGINAEPAPGETRTAAPVRGPELLMFMNLVKQIATDRWPKAEQVEVLVDRSQQLGLDANTRRMEDGVVEVFGPDHLNTAPGGGPSQFQCVSKFRIVSSPEDGLFADLLMLPDAVGYLRQREGGHEEGCDHIRGGEHYWMRYDDVAAFRIEAERRSVAADPADLEPLERESRPAEH